MFNRYLTQFPCSGIYNWLGPILMHPMIAQTFLGGSMVKNHQISACMNAFTEGSARGF